MWNNCFLNVRTFGTRISIYLKVSSYTSLQCMSQMVDAWGGWSQFQVLLRTLKRIASKHGVSIPTVAVKYVLDQVISVNMFMRLHSYFIYLFKAP